MNNAKAKNEMRGDNVGLSLRDRIFEIDFEAKTIQRMEVDETA
jgi:hypothetical protein